MTMSNQVDAFQKGEEVWFDLSFGPEYGKVANTTESHVLISVGNGLEVIELPKEEVFSSKAELEMPVDNE